MSTGKISRRQLLQWAGAGLLVNTVGTILYDPLGKLILPANAKLGETLFSHELIPELELADLELGQLIVNSYKGTPAIDLTTFQLRVEGQVQRPLNLTMADIRQLPFDSQITQHVCVEGWAAVVQWGGAKMVDILNLAGVQPQTLLAYQKNDAPLPAENGAPLRLAAPIKLGYKLSKWVTKIIVTDQLRAERGYWEDQGYDWFASI
jgi:DMSO/TMAO reductase YedYZ molybdopterin-dependent catalytic subunit